MPEAFLNRTLEGSEQEQQRQLSLIANESPHGPVLAKINIKHLIKWCLKIDDVTVWSAVAKGINLWKKTESEAGISLTEKAIQLLEASSDYKILIEAFSECIELSGSLIEEEVLRQARADAIGKLRNHSNSQISIAAESAYKQANERLEKERLRRQCWDAQREQRFE